MKDNNNQNGQTGADTNKFTKEIGDETEDWLVGITQEK